jgi:hypothetical protein
MQILRLEADHPIWSRALLARSCASRLIVQILRRWRSSG